MEQDPSTEGTPELIADTLDLSTYILSEAFENVYSSSGSASYAEWVQLDRVTLPGLTLFSVLLSESGGKADEGVNMLRIVAFPTEQEYAGSIELAAAVSHLGDEIPFSTDRFIYERTYAERGLEPILVSVGEKDGVVRMHRGVELERRVAEAHSLDFDALLKGGIEGSESLTPDTTNQLGTELSGGLSPEDGLLLLEITDITADNTNWPIIPQN
jgi:hypothetical protein